MVRPVGIPVRPNGEVEGPDDHAGQTPRAHNLSRDSRRQTDHASRPPPTIVRRFTVALKGVLFSAIS
jgi:hypothetical protein